MMVSRGGSIYPVVVMDYFKRWPTPGEPKSTSHELWPSGNFPMSQECLPEPVDPWVWAPVSPNWSSHELQPLSLLLLDTLRVDEYSEAEGRELIPDTTLLHRH